MKNLVLTTLSILILLLGTSVSFVNKAYGASDVDIVILQKQFIAMQKTLMGRIEAMEETINKQQETIDGLKIPPSTHNNNIEPENSDFKDVIGREIDNYFAQENAREKMAAIGLVPKLDFGYKKGFYLKTLDNKFSVKIRNRLQFKYQFTDRNKAQDESTFDFRRIRTELSGHAYDENIKYKLEWDISFGLALLLEAYIDITYVPWANIWAGQGKVFSRQVLTSGAALQMIDRSAVSEEFIFQGDKRKRGVAIHSDKIFGGKIDYSIGVYNPQISIVDNNINTMLYLARASYYPFGPYESYKESDIEYSETFKAHISGGLGFDQGSGADIDRTQILGEFGFKYKGLSLTSEYHNRKQTSGGGSLNDQGFFIQGGYFIIPKKLEITGRYELIDFDNQNPVFATSVFSLFPQVVGILDNQRFYTAGLNYFFHGRDHKIQINYIYRKEELSGSFVSDGNENVILTQYQIYF